MRRKRISEIKSSLKQLRNFEWMKLRWLNKRSTSTSVVGIERIAKATLLKSGSESFCFFQNSKMFVSARKRLRSWYFLSSTAKASDAQDLFRLQLKTFHTFLDFWRDEETVMTFVNFLAIENNRLRLIIGIKSGNDSVDVLEDGRLGGCMPACWFSSNAQLLFMHCIALQIVFI